jgi:hypothetical protein
VAASVLGPVPVRHSTDIIVLTIAASVQKVPAVSLWASKGGYELVSVNVVPVGGQVQVDAIVMMRLLPNTAEMRTTSSHLAVNTDIEFIIH